MEGGRPLAWINDVPWQEMDEERGWSSVRKMNGAKVWKSLCVRLSINGSTCAEFPTCLVVAAGARLARAVMTREMAHVCADRLQHCRTLEELCGRRTEYARRAVAELQDRTDSQEQHQQDELKQVHTVELERVRAEGAGRIIERLAHVLVADEGWQETQIPSVAVAPTSASKRRHQKWRRRS